MNIPILKLPIPGGGATALLVNSIVQATSNSQNPEWTDVYLVGQEEVTVDMSIDTFFAAWLMMLQDEEIDDVIREITGSDLH